MWLKYNRPTLAIRSDVAKVEKALLLVVLTTPWNGTGQLDELPTVERPTCLNPVSTFSSRCSCATDEVKNIVPVMSLPADVEACAVVNMCANQ